jgi:hypothetical protein
MGEFERHFLKKKKKHFPQRFKVSLGIWMYQPFPAGKNKDIEELKMYCHYHSPLYYKSLGFPFKHLI